MVDGENENIAPPFLLVMIIAIFLAKLSPRLEFVTERDLVKFFSNKSSCSVRIVIGEDLLQFLDLPVQTSKTIFVFASDA